MRVFLVDDEFLQRALVKKTVDWNSLGMEYVEKQKTEKKH